MTPEDILALAVPGRNPRVGFGRFLYDFMVTNKLSVGLQLRRTPGISTLYLAGAIHAQGGGLLRSIWRAQSKPHSYDLVHALHVTGLSRFVSVYEEPTSYNWRLMDFLKDGRFEEFDFCLIERGTTWFEAGYGVCLAERLIKPGGWIILDNLHFTFRESTRRDSGWVRKKPEEEQTTRQIERVFELLVQENPYFGTFQRRGSVALSQKKQAVWSSTLRRKNKIELLIGRAVERASRDPEFRQELLRFPRRAMALMSGDALDGLGPIRFVDTVRPVPLSPGTDVDGTRIIYLEQPKWERRINEESLTRMLKE